MIIRDPVHGDITLTPEETRVLDTPEIQRLRGIKQLGAAHLVYPGAVHTRFEHSLGTLHMARRIMDALAAGGYALSPEARRATSVAALVHDVTHIPYGHTFEDERRIFARHDSGHRLNRFLEGRLGAVLQELGLKQTVSAILAARTGSPPAPGIAPWQAQVVSGCVDADLLDYLCRDSLFCGLSQRYDDRILRTFVLDDQQLVMNLTKDGSDRPDIRSEILHLLYMRYFLTERVYLHHAKIAAGAMISRAVELAVARGLSEDQLYPLGDQTLFSFLQRFPARRPDPAIAGLIEGVSQRRLYKRAYVLSPDTLGPAPRQELVQRYAGQSREREMLEDAIARRAGIGLHEVIVYCPAASAFKEIAVPVRSRLGVLPLARLAALTGGPADELARRYEHLWRFYVFAPARHLDRVARVTEQILSYPSERRISGA